MLYVYTVDSRGEVETEIGEYYATPLAVIDARISAAAAGKHGFTGRAEIRNSYNQTIYRICNRNGVVNERGIY